MAANRHTCCICHQPRHPVEKHHIDGDPSNNTWDNLAVLCRNCHGLVTSKSNLGSNYSPGEVLQYKNDWEKRCAHADHNEIDSPLEAFHETKLIGANENEEYPFEMEKDEELVFSIDADEYLDAVICDEEDIEEWADEDDAEDEDALEDGDEDEESRLPENYWCRTDIVKGEYSFLAPRKGRYILLLINWAAESTEVIVDAALWRSS